MDARLQDNLKEMQHNYIAPFLWLHNEDDSLIVDELQRIYDSGIRSVCLESRTHEEFVREDWWSDVGLILEWCRTHEMQVWILDDKHFPSGYANGIFKEKYKELQPWCIGEYHLDISGPVRDGCAMAECWRGPDKDEILAVLACRHIPCTEKYSEVIDITEGLHEGMVYFTLPEGMWRILFLVKTRTTLQTTVFCDMLNPQAVRLFIREVYDSHYEHFREYFGNTLRGFFSDEPAFHNSTRMARNPNMGEPYHRHPWSDRVMEQLTERFGADAKRMLAGLWCDICETAVDKAVKATESTLSEQIRYAYMDIITREYQHNFTNQIADWCHAHGVEYIGHIIEDMGIHAKTGDGPGHYFRSLDGQDMSGIDVVLNQIVPGLTECNNARATVGNHTNSSFYHYYLGKLGSSMAHMDPRTGGRAMCEIFGAYGWAEGTKMMKYLLDHMLVRGINYFVPHAFSPKLNDPDCPPNFYDRGENAQYKYFRLIMDYMNRMCYMLSDGVHVPSAAILYDAEAAWVNGERLPLEDVGKVLYDNLLDYDILPADVLEQMDENGYVNGEKYPCLLVPCYEGMPEIICEKLRKVPVKVIFVTRQGMCDEERNNVAAGYGTEFETVELTQLASYLRTNMGADVTSDYEGIYLRYYHYVRNGAHLYMFSNEDIHHTIRTKVTLSAFNGGKYILYDALENRAIAGFSETGEIGLELSPYHSLLVLCGDVDGEEIPCGDLRDLSRTCAAVEDAWEQGNPCCNGLSEMITWEDILTGSRAETVEETMLSPIFRISYAREKDTEFTPYRTTAQLCNITGWDQMPEFSGNIRYEGEFEVKEAALSKNRAGACPEKATAGEENVTQSWFLDLGQVGEAVEVFVNGISVGKRIIPPYAFEITGAVREGNNTLTVVVSNHSGFQKRDEFSRYLLFEPSGLLGPIVLKRRE